MFFIELNRPTWNFPASRADRENSIFSKPTRVNVSQNYILIDISEHSSLSPACKPTM